MRILQAVAMVLSLFCASEALAQSVSPGLDAYRALAEGTPAPESSTPVDASNPYLGLTADDYARAADEISMLSRTSSGLNAFRENLTERIAAAPSAFDEVRRTLREASPTGEATHFLYVILQAIALLLIAYFATGQILGKRVFGPWFIPKQQAITDPQGMLQKLPILSLRAGIGFVLIVVSVIVAIILMLAIYDEPDDATEKTRIVVIVTFALILIVATMWRMILSPFLPRYRIPVFSDRDAKKLFRWLWIGAALGLTFQAYCAWMESLGLDYNIHALVTSGLTLILVAVNIAMVIANHEAISYVIRGCETCEATTWPARLGASLWAPAAVAYFVIAWLEMTWRLIMGDALRAPLIVGAYVILLAIIVVYGVVSYAVEWFFSRARRTQVDGMEVMGEDGEETSMMPAALSVRRMETMEDLAGRVASVFALVAGVIALLQIWDVEDSIFGANFVSGAIDILIVCFVAYVAYHAVRIWIDQRIQEEGGGETRELGDEGGAGGASRLATLLPLFRNILLFVIVLTAALVVLLEMGLNVAPVFAGAGVLGLAIGFGAQTLIRDIFSGAFFLIDDAFRKGEYIDVGDVKGTVEKISIRSFQLRHHRGPLHTIPFGEIQFLTNFSRDWVVMKLPLRVTYDTDVEKVRKMIKKLGQGLLEDEELGPKFLQPLKSQGVVQMEDSAMIIRVKFATKPGDQWEIRKRVYNEIRELFAREGIRFAHREVTVRLAEGGERPLDDAQKRTIAGAALPLLDNDMAMMPESGDRD